MNYFSNYFLNGIWLKKKKNDVHEVRMTPIDANKKKKKTTIFFRIY